MHYSYQASASQSYYNNAMVTQNNKFTLAIIYQSYDSIMMPGSFSSANALYISDHYLAKL